jgi:hypothetical protein
MAKRFAAGGKVVIHEAELRNLVAHNKYIRDALVKEARKVAGEAQATASAAEAIVPVRGAGYAQAGFSVEWVDRGGKRPTVRIHSLADLDVWRRVHFATQTVNGVGHLRAALYKFTYRGVR